MGCCMFAGYAYNRWGQAHNSFQGRVHNRIRRRTRSAVPGHLRASQISLWISAGAFAALAGLYYITVPSSGLGDLNLGDLLVLCCAVPFAFHIIAIGHYAPRYSAGKLNLLQVMMTLLLLLLAGPLLIVAGRQPIRISGAPGC